MEAKGRLDPLPGDRGTARQEQVPPVLPLEALDSGMLAVAGGKAANLGELLRAGMPVPPGFCVTTAAYEAVSAQAGIGVILDQMASLPAMTSNGNAERLRNLAALAREAILAAPLPDDVAEAVRAAYAGLGHADPAAAVAVRSSATAEDLPFASFAGQQDTYLNVVGAEAVLDAVRRCWASLWTERAVSYRASNNIDQRTVRLAVVVQRMVDAEVAGVLFTANPLTGRRREVVIDSSPGLGEAVVSGAVNPDHFVVDTATGQVVEQRLGDKRLAVRSVPGGGTARVDLEGGESASLTGQQLQALARLGEGVERHFGKPQDIEWAIDQTGKIWLTQSRPITTLYPLPSGAPSDPDDLRVYFSVNVAQGMYRPFTTMGIAALRLMFSSGATVANLPPANPRQGPRILVEAGQRLFFDMTTAIRSKLGRFVISKVMSKMEARSAVVFAYLFTDPRLQPVTTPRGVVALRVLKLLPNLRRVPFHAAQAMISPRASRKRLARMERWLRTLGSVPDDTSPQERLDMFERLLVENTGTVILSALPLIIVVFGLPAVLARLLGDLATEGEQQAILRSLPHNPTTEMDLALWKLARRVSADADAVRLLRGTTPERLASLYRDGKLPATLQQGLADFLRVYGHRAVAEFDFGMPRWAENPAYILQVLNSYLDIKDPAKSPAAQFQRGAREARAMVAELERRAATRGRVRGAVTGFVLSRIRGLTGLREVPKYFLMLLMWRGRQLLLPVGEALARQGRIEQPGDIFFLDTAEARRALDGEDMRALVQQRRERYDQELSRRHIPRVLLSDGTEPETQLLSKQSVTADTGGALTGTPASAGLVTGTARVVLDPVGATLEPGEILVAPSTDPGWTPLFLTAGGLVMEMGGAMSHGAVVAREYGIPAVVGLPGATQRISTGQQITVDGSSGKVSVS